MTTEVTQSRRPFTGSCDCGAIKYIVYLNIPHLRPKRAELPAQVTYCCNCAVCQKSGVLHLRLLSEPYDFALLSPLDPFGELSDYQRNEKRLHWPFCKTCGVRCFTFTGQHEITEAELPGVSAEGEKTRFWHPAKEGWVEGGEKGGYMSVNALTIDGGQEGIDLVEWAEQKMLLYADNLELNGKPKGAIGERPSEGGCF